MIYRRDDAAQKIRVTACDSCTVEDLVDVIERQWMDRTWHYAALYDLREFFWHPTTDDIHQLVTGVQRLAAPRPRGPIALVVSDPLALQRSAHFAVLKDRLMRVCVFETPARAEAWLERESRTGAHVGG